MITFLASLICFSVALVMYYLYKKGWGFRHPLQKWSDFRLVTFDLDFIKPKKATNWQRNNLSLQVFFWTVVGVVFLLWPFLMK